MAFVEFFSNTGTGASMAVAAPSGVGSGDFQLCVFVIGSSSASITGVPSGWTQRAALTSAGGGDSYRAYIYTSTTITGSSTWTQPSGAREWRAVRAGWTDVGAASAVTLGVNGTTTSHPIPSATPQGAGATVIGGVLWDMESAPAGTTHSPPAGWTERVDVFGNWLGMSIADYIAPSTSAVTGSFTKTVSREAMTFSLSLAPPAAPAVPTGRGLIGHL